MSESSLISMPLAPSKRRRVLLLGLVIAAVTFSILNSPCLLYGFIPSLNPLHESAIQLTGRTIFVSDFHLDGQANPDFDGLRRFIVNEDVANMVIVGDLFESLETYRKMAGQPASPEAAFRKAITLLTIDGLKLNIYLITGSPAHDPQNLSGTFTFGDVKFQLVGRLGLFEISGVKLIAYHGDDACRIGPLAFTLSYSTRSLMLEKAWKRLAGIEEKVWVIMGHTHIPGVDYDSRIANGGGWKQIPILNPPRGYALVVHQDGIELVKLTG